MIKSDYLKFLKKQEVVGKPIVDKIGKLNKFYLPLSEWLYSVYKKDNKIKIIGLSGGQGAGKSTITGILKFILKARYGLELCIFSLIFYTFLFIMWLDIEEKRYIIILKWYFQRSLKKKLKIF